MKKIEKMIYEIKDEIHGAKRYAEKYIEHKATHPDWARMYHDMAEQEIQHAENLRVIGQGVINGLAWVSEEDKEAWTICGNCTAEKVALVRLMLQK